jgi:hypothetical protein
MLKARVVKVKITMQRTVMRSRLRSTTVEPEADRFIVPPNMSERPPPRPEWRRMKRIIAKETITWITTRAIVSTPYLSFPRLRSLPAHHRRRPAKRRSISHRG